MSRIGIWSCITVDIFEATLKEIQNKLEKVMEIVYENSSLTTLSLARDFVLSEKYLDSTLNAKLSNHVFIFVLPIDPASRFIPKPISDSGCTSTLPDEILQKIFSDIPDVFSFVVVNKRWNALLRLLIVVFLIFKASSLILTNYLFSTLHNSCSPYQ